MESKSLWCWVCRKKLQPAMTGPLRGTLVWAVVVDKLGNQHRTHKTCVATAVENDTTLLTNQTAAATDEN